MNWVILTILSAITGSLTRIFQKKLLASTSIHPILFAFVFQLIVAGTFFAITILTHTFEIPDLSTVLINLVLMAALYGFGNYFNFKAYKTTEASEVAVLFSSSMIWSIIAAFFLLKEAIQVSNLFGVCLILIGIIAINVRQSNWKLQKGHLFALLAAACFGIAFTNDAFIISHYASVSSYMVIAFFLPALFTLSLQPTVLKRYQNIISKKSLFLLACAAGAYTVSALTIFTAYKQGGQASVIAPLQQSQVAITVILSYLFLGERTKISQKIIGVLCCFFGALLLI